VPVLVLLLILGGVIIFTAVTMFLRNRGR